MALPPTAASKAPRNGATTLRHEVKGSPAVEVIVEQPIEEGEHHRTREPSQQL
jgi:hypothetical protein